MNQNQIQTTANTKLTSMLRRHMNKDESKFPPSRIPLIKVSQIPKLNNRKDLRDGR